jgi:hypothetical protein
VRRVGIAKVVKPNAGEIGSRNLAIPIASEGVGL